jgi:hypothetical protein
MSNRLFVFCFLLTTLCVGCTAQIITPNKPVMFASVEDFRLGPKAGVDLVWSTKRVRDAETLKETFQNYDSLILGQTWVAIDETTSTNIDDEQILAISKQVIVEIKSRLGQGFKIVEAPTDSTLRLCIALSNREVSIPVLAVLGDLYTDGIGASTVSRIVTDAHVNAGSINVEILVSDAENGEPLVAMIDKQFVSQDVGALIGSPEFAKKDISLWADRLWTTLSYWNWIKPQKTSSL